MSGHALRSGVSGSRRAGVPFWLELGAGPRVYEVPVKGEKLRRPLLG